jgi:hypothetical protein
MGVETCGAKTGGTTTAKDEIARIVTMLREIRRIRDVVVTDIVLPLYGFNCVLR